MVPRVAVDGHAATRELDDRLRARVDVERAQDRRDVHLDRALGEAEVAADQLVRLALREQTQHLRLARGEAERLRARRAGSAGSRGRAPAAGRDDRRAAGAPRRRAASPLAVLAMKPFAPAASALSTVRAVVRRRQHRDRQPREVAAQRTEQLEALGAGQREVEQQERAIGVRREQRVRRVAVAGARASSPPRPIAGASCASAVRISGWSSTTSTFTRAPGRKAHGEMPGVRRDCRPMRDAR